MFINFVVVGKSEKLVFNAAGHEKDSLCYLVEMINLAPVCWLCNISFKCKSALQLIVHPTAAKREKSDSCLRIPRVLIRNSSYNARRLSRPIVSTHFAPFFKVHILSLDCIVPSRIITPSFSIHTQTQNLHRKERVANHINIYNINLERKSEFLCILI